MPPIGNEDFTAEELAEFSAQGVNIEPAAPDFIDGEATVAGAAADDTLEAGESTVAGGQATEAVESGTATEAPNGFVPHAALHAERQRSAEINRRLGAATARMNAMLAAQATEAPRAAEAPTLETDPIGYMEHIEQRLNEMQVQTQQRETFNVIDTQLNDEEEGFKLITPDYEQAAEHYVRSRASELQMFATPQQAQQYLREEVRQIAQESWKRGMSAPEAIYNLAKMRGYAGPAPRAAAPTPTPTPTPAARPSAAAQVAAITRGQAASRSLSGGGGSSPQDLNADALLNMTDDEFEAWLSSSKDRNAKFAGVGGR